MKKIKKILDTLIENGGTKRTLLSVKTGMNYDRCMKYVNTLKILKLIEVILDNNCGYVMITQAGKEIFNLLECI
ncbi:MAG: winged helix-turn-helix domain-containing protein [Nitrosotalea sp.]